MHLVYRPNTPQGASKDHEFSRSSMEARWQQGISDGRTALRASPWLAPMPRELGARVFDMTGHFPRKSQMDDRQRPINAAVDGDDGHAGRR